MTATWTAPRTWVDGEVPTEAMLNAHWRDNMEFLKLIRDASGRFNDLSSATLLSTDASALDDVVPLAGATLTGRNDYSAAYLRLPVGADLYDGAPGNKTAGSIWVEGTALNWVNDSQIEHSWAGLATGISPGAGYAGFVMIYAHTLRYVDASGALRYILGTYVDAPADARNAAVWMESYLNWIHQTTKNRYSGVYNVHDDHGYQDSPYSDSPHVDNPGYSDSVHTDSGGVHTDSPVHADNTPYTPHYDTMVHSDSTSPHTDSTPHTDTAHGDTPHTDTPHTDNAAYNDHVDQPTVVGP
jgi:hypothetical protein